MFVKFSLWRSLSSCLEMLLYVQFWSHASFFMGCGHVLRPFILPFIIKILMSLC